MEIPTEHNDYIVGFIPNPPRVYMPHPRILIMICMQCSIFMQIWRSLVDFQKDATVENMYQKHEKKVYPPRILMVATAKTEGAIFKLHVKFKGCSRECELNHDLCFPLGKL